MQITERTPFYLIATIFLFVTIILSIISTFNTTSNKSDFFPIGGLYNEQTIRSTASLERRSDYGLQHYKCNREVAPKDFRMNRLS
jgi:hypothetical protein